LDINYLSIDNKALVLLAPNKNDTMFRQNRLDLIVKLTVRYPITLKCKSCWLALLVKKSSNILQKWLLSTKTNWILITLNVNDNQDEKYDLLCQQHLSKCWQKLKWTIWCPKLFLHKFIFGLRYRLNIWWEDGTVIKSTVERFFFKF